MKRSKVACLVLTLAVAGITASAVTLAKPRPPLPPNCRYVLCAYPDCGPNEHTEIPAGQCCPVCVPN